MGRPRLNETQVEGEIFNLIRNQSRTTVEYKQTNETSERKGNQRKESKALSTADSGIDKAAQVPEIEYDYYWDDY